MLLSTYKINKALSQLDTDNTIIIRNVTDSLISICDKQHPNWESDDNSKEYKFLHPGN